MKSDFDWKIFYDGLHTLIGEQTIQNIKLETENMFEREARFNLLQIEAVQKYYSSTHTWVKGKVRNSNKLMSGWYIHDLECQVCGMGATKFHKLGWTCGKIAEIKDGEFPSSDGHGSFIHLTCEEALALRHKYKKQKKGGKCLQCGIYGCSK